MNIVDLYDMLPLTYNKRTVDFLSKGDLYNYIEILRTDYYNKYLEHDFSKMGSIELVNYLMDRCVMYKLGVNTKEEARIVVKDIITDEIISGCTLFFRDETSIVLGYFTVEKFRGKGEATKMLGNIIDKICKCIDSCILLEAKVMANNNASIKVLEKLGFVATGNKNKNNILKFYRLLGGTDNNAKGS